MNIKLTSQFDGENPPKGPHFYMEMSITQFYNMQHNSYRIFNMTCYDQMRIEGILL